MVFVFCIGVIIVNASTLSIFSLERIRKTQRTGIKKEGMHAESVKHWLF